MLGAFLAAHRYLRPFIEGADDSIDIFTGSARSPLEWRQNTPAILLWEDEALPTHISTKITMPESPTIRRARVEDVPLILQLIKAGAEDQAPGSTIRATEEQLRKTLNFEPAQNEATSAPRVGWPLLMFSPDEKPAGLLIYFFNYSTWLAAPGVCLEELYVVPEYRGSGYGYARMLIEAMAAAAEEAGCEKMEWACLLNNERALKFYDKLGAKRMVDWTTLKVDRQGIERLASKGRQWGI